MSASGRFVILRVIFPDRPGALAALTAALAELRLNVLSVDHHRRSAQLAIDQTEVLAHARDPRPGAPRQGRPVPREPRLPGPRQLDESYRPFEACRAVACTPHLCVNPFVKGEDGRSRCPWCVSSPEYHAVPRRGMGPAGRTDDRIYEKLCLEGFQSGLSWLTILRKRDGVPQQRSALSTPPSWRSTGMRRWTSSVSDASIVRKQGQDPGDHQQRQGDAGAAGGWHSRWRGCFGSTNPSTPSTAQRRDRARLHT